MAKHDVVVIGAGHNGLIVAAYFAKAGLDVCVLEKANFLGGAVNSIELTKPGFKHDMGGTGHTIMMYNPLILKDELQLQSQYGLKYIVPEAAAAYVFPDDTAIIDYQDLDKACQSIAQFSEKDAETYRQFMLNNRPMIDMFAAGLFQASPPLGAFFSQLDQTPEGQDLIKYFFMSAYEIVEDLFEHEKTKLVMTRLAAEVLVGPEDKGTGICFMLAVCMCQLYSVGLPVGGSGELCESLRRCIEAHGGMVKLKSEVEKIEVSGGRARAVVLSSGEQIEARKAVVANLDPRLVFPTMVSDVSPRLIDRVSKIKGPSYSVFMSHLALNEPPRYKAGDEVLKAHHIELMPWEEDFRRMFDEFRYGRPPAVLSPLTSCPTTHDATRAPEGKHILYVCQFEPYNLKDGGPDKWNDIKREVGDQILECVRKYTTNMGTENIIARTIQSPRDLERWNCNLVKGAATGPGNFLHQSFSYRPVPELSQYRSPLDGLYFSGHAFHPGGAISGCGRNTVLAMMEDMGIDFKKTVA